MVRWSSGIERQTTHTQNGLCTAKQTARSVSYNHNQLHEVGCGGGEDEVTGSHTDLDHLLRLLGKKVSC